MLPAPMCLTQLPWGSPHALPSGPAARGWCLCWGHLSWPALLQLALTMPWYLPFLRPGPQAGSGSLQEGRSGQMQAKKHDNPAQLSSVKFYCWAPKSWDFTLGWIFHMCPIQDDVHRVGCTVPTSLHPKKGLPLPHCFCELLTGPCKQDISNLSYISVAD